MKNLSLILILPAVFLFAACEIGDGDEPDGTQACSDTTTEEVSGDVTPSLDEDADTATEVSVKALDLVGTPTVTISDNTLTCIILVDDIPEDEMLYMNHNDLSSGKTNFQWSVRFDINSDTKDDYYISLSLVSANVEQGYDDISDNMKVKLFKVDGTITSTVTTGNLILVSDNSLSNSADSITITVSDDIVSSIEDCPEIWAYTMMNNGLETYSDCRQIATSF